MYERSAEVYDALRRGKDYAAACRQLRRIFERLAPEARTLLDVACGTGRHLEHLRDHYRAEGLDASAAMLTVAGRRCRDTPLHHCSMTDFCLGRTYDVVTCLFGSIGYVGDTAALGRAVRTMAGHLAPGGILVIEPWLTPERFVAGRPVLDTVDEPELKVARGYVTRREGRLSIFDSHYVVATPDGAEHYREREVLALFTAAEYHAALQDAALEIVPGDAELFGYGLYVAMTPPARSERQPGADQ